MEKTFEDVEDDMVAFSCLVLGMSGDGKKAGARGISDKRKGGIYAWTLNFPTENHRRVDRGATKPVYNEDKEMHSLVI